MKTMSRREFLRAGVGVAATISSLEMIGGCATTETPKVKTLVFPSLPYNKIQPPQEGCLVGFFIEPEASIAWHANNPRIAANLRDRFPHPYAIDDAEKWLAYVQSKEPETHFAIATPSEAIGGIGLELLDDVHYQTAELGYWIDEDYWGKGIMTAAVTVFTEYAFKNYDFIRIFAAVFDSNPASVRVLEKAGYTFEGRLRRSVNKNGKILDQLMYAKVK